MTLCSRLPGFYDMGLEERVYRLADMLCLTEEQQHQLLREPLTPEVADVLIENVVGVFGLPLGIATNFRINSRDYLIPMAVEETSIVAAASSAARLLRQQGLLSAAATDPVMIGQIQIANVPDFEGACQRLEEAKERLLFLANAQDPTLVKLGGGAHDLEYRKVDSQVGPMLIIHILVDVRDAMGANTVNTMAEMLGPIMAELAGGEVVCRIISNLSDRRLARAHLEVPVAALARAGFSGEHVARRIVQAYAMAASDPYRAATHNKGIMNAVDAVLVATGNDWRAVEAGAHAYASRSGCYTSLSHFYIEDGQLMADIEMPMALGTIGGVTRLHPTVKLVQTIMGVRSASELAGVIVAAGLVQNFSALRSLVSEGIQRGHMTLHARNLAILAGAEGALVGRVAGQMVREGKVRYHRAVEILAQLNGRGAKHGD